MTKSILLVLGISVVGGWPGGVARADDAAPIVAATEPAAEIVTPPGGGDMVILDPASRYVTHARRDRTGRIRARCAREAGAALERANEAEQP
jgi:hypothetical protein